MKKVTIFNIQHFSLHDGPGTRSVIFFKGCNLRCAWCHNPESLSSKRDILYYPQRCIGCMACVQKCPHHALSMSEQGIVRNTQECRKCFDCCMACCAQAQKAVGEEVEIEWLKKLIKENSVYYSQSGGVTFSGGECMLQLSALEELLVFCRENQIHTAVDTAGNTAWEDFERIIPYTDVFLYDIKAWDREIHKKCTGTGNERILDNYKNLIKRGVPCIVRIPYVPDWNDMELPAIAEFLKEYAPLKTELLAYHDMGRVKEEALGNRTDRTFNIPSKEEIEELKKKYKFI